MHNGPGRHAQSHAECAHNSAGTHAQRPAVSIGTIQQIQYVLAVGIAHIVVMGLQIVSHCFGNRFHEMHLQKNLSYVTLASDRLQVIFSKKFF